MPDRPPTFYAAVYLIVRKGEAVLFLHRKSTGWMDGYWGLPAGHIEGSEKMVSAACREAEEETGLQFSPQEVQLKHVMHRPSNSGRIYFDFFFTAELGNREAKNGEPEKHDELRWFPLANLPETLIPYLKRVFERITGGVFFSEDITETV